MPTFGGSPTCPVCQQKVYFAEEVKCLSKSYHKLCLKCCNCSKILDPSSINDHDGSIYCRVCYGKSFGPKGYGFAAGSAGLQSDAQQSSSRRYSPVTLLEPSLESWQRKAPGQQAQSGGGSGAPAPAQAAGGAGRFGGAREQCIRCQSNVYFNERVQASGRVFHRSCFKCRDCAKPLEAGSESEHKREVFCRGCYSKTYGTKGFVAGSSMHVS